MGLTAQIKAQCVGAGCDSVGRAEWCRIESNSVFIARTEWWPNHKAAAGNCGTKLRSPYSAKAQAKWSTIFLPEWNGGFAEKGAGRATGKMPI